MLWNPLVDSFFPGDLFGGFRGILRHLCLAHRSQLQPGAGVFTVLGGRLESMGVQVFVEI